jgi:hypothetical protein
LPKNEGENGDAHSD